MKWAAAANSKVNRSFCALSHASRARFSYLFLLGFRFAPPQVYAVGRFAGWDPAPRRMLFLAPQSGELNV